MIVEAIIPIFGIRRNATVVRMVGRKRIREILWPIRNSSIDKASYAKIRDLWPGATTDANDFPQSCEPWRSVIGRFNLDDAKKLDSWTPVVDTFIKIGWGSPRDLSLVNNGHFQSSVACFPQKQLAPHLWAASVLLFADLSSASFLLLKGASSDSEKLTSALQTSPARFNAAHSNANQDLACLKVRKGLGKIGPSARLRRLRAAQLPQFKHNRPLPDGLPKSGLIGDYEVLPLLYTRYSLILKLLRTRAPPPFPVRELAVVAWSSISRP